MQEAYGEINLLRVARVTLPSSLRTGGDGEAQETWSDSFILQTDMLGTRWLPWLPSPSSCHNATTFPVSPGTGHSWCWVRLMARLPQGF